AAAGADPNVANRFYLYAIGGRDGTTAKSTYTFAQIDVAADGSQTVGTFSNDTPLLASGRWQLGAIAMDHARASHIPDGQTWIYALNGMNGAGTSTVDQATAGMVGADGTLAPVFEVDAHANEAGYGLAGANNFLFMFGGVGGGLAPADTAISGNL